MNEYLLNVTGPNQKTLVRLYESIRKIIPGTEESFSYGIPTFKYKKRPLLGFTANKHHLSIYPFSPRVIVALREKLSTFEVSKGTIRFTSDNPLPMGVLKKLLALRRKEIDEAANKK